MKAFCAWCRRDGLVGFLGDREPLDDPGETHGICPRHHAELIAELHRDLSAPPAEPARTLVVVHPRERSLYEYLRHRLAPVKDVEVIVDRRRGERRCARQAVANERRRHDRRQRRLDMSLLGYAIVRLDSASAARRSGAA
ncbi:MAG TPA: hypothetical protein VNO23_19390 [Candidatus Binatia bacterium]|nr:hypothetical protein [Candidatus Binatia bacterium]